MKDATIPVAAAPEARSTPVDTASPHRLVALDSLRGLAALTVVICHALWLCKPDTPLRDLFRSGIRTARSFDGLIHWLREMPVSFLIETSPLHLFVAGHEAVILFYLLSGFVLYLTYERPQPDRYRLFIIRRVCRLYIPYVAALALAVGLNATVSTGHLPEMNAFFNHTWYVPVNWSQALEHLALIGSFDTDLFLMPSWTLVHEMRMSILFPILVGVVGASGRWLPLVLLAASAIGITLDTRLAASGNYFITLHYATFFMAGAWMARHRRWSMAYYTSLSPARRVLLLSLALLLYVFGRMASILTGLPVAVADLPVGAGAALLVLWSLSNPPLLRLRLVQWLGKLSYGLYLLHFTIYLAAIYLLHDLLPLWAILLLGGVLSFVAAALFWRLVEAPAIRLGRHLTTPAPALPVPVRVPPSATLAPPRESRL